MFRRIKAAFSSGADLYPAPDPAPLPSPHFLEQQSPDEAKRIFDEWTAAWENKRKHDKEAFENALLRERLCIFLKAGASAYNPFPRENPYDNHFSWCPMYAWKKQSERTPIFYEGQREDRLFP